MSVDVRGLIGSPGEQRELDLTVPVEGYGPPGEEVRFEPATVRLVLTGTPGGVLVDAEARSVAELVCGRCLAPFTEPVTAGFKHLFVVAAPGDQESVGQPRGGDRKPREAEEVSWSDEDVPDVSPIIDGHIEVTPLVGEALALGLPMKPLCRADCLGLCPVCGHNLNEGPCGCGQEEIDPRLAVLERLVSPEPEKTTPGPKPAGEKEKDQRGPAKT